MPIKIDNSTFDDFDKAVEHVMRTKGLSKNKANAYVGTVDRNENKSAKTILAQLKLSRLKMAFEESEHPRDKGKFTTKESNNLETLKRLREKETRPGEQKVLDQLIDKEKNKSAKTLLAQLKLTRLKLKMADTYNDDSSPDNYQYDKGKVIKKAKENGTFDIDFDERELRLGVLYELRYTNDQIQARERAKKNLKSDPDFYSKLMRDETYQKLGYKSAKQTFGIATMDGIIKWWDDSSVSKRQHAIDPNRIFPWSLSMCRRFWEDLNTEERVKVILGFCFRHQDMDFKQILGYNLNESPQLWWDTWNTSQRQHMVDPHQYEESYIMCTKSYEDLNVPERERINNTHTNKFVEFTGVKSAMRLASQNGKYAKYWILNAKDVNGNGWGVSPSTIKQNMASFKGKPFVITAKTWIANSEYENQYDHPYISSTDVNTVLNYQEKFRVGNIEEIIEDELGDYYAMIEIDDQYKHLPLPPFCSPAIYQLDLNEPEGDISKWVGLHLAGLIQDPAYGPRVAILRGACIGTHGQCLTQFKQQ